MFINESAVLQNNFFLLLNFISKHKKIIWSTLNFFLASQFGQLTIGKIIHTSLLKNPSLTASIKDPSWFLQAEVSLQDRWQQFTYEHKLKLCPPMSETPECIAVVFCYYGPLG